ncbi:SNARE domain containing protein [Rhodotorula toruloides]|uniref:SNARE domain containing protein n=1 Tax=Rhodotorula toruloides TaxID=5286 RepID=A0A511KLH4_RHOTO|nr:SNARE domain containing protein [Rhodotorula toruloides]
MAPASSSSGPATAARLSHLSSTTLSSVLDLTRLSSLSLPTPPNLTHTIQRNLSTLARGIEELEDSGTESKEVVDGLRGQWERIRGLVEPLGVEVTERLRENKDAGGKTGRLVETDEEEGDDLVAVSEPSPHVAIPVQDDRRDLAQMEEDEEEMERANQEVLQMQKRMIEDQDTQLDSLSSAISRQHALSLRVAEELELHSSLLDDTDSALDRTQSNLRRASGRLDQFTRRAKNTGSTGLIVALIILLVILIVIFKL